jgi:hypothetical protein
MRREVAGADERRAERLRHAGEGGAPHIRVRLGDDRLLGVVRLAGESGRDGTRQRRALLPPAALAIDQPRGSVVLVGSAGALIEGGGAARG